MGQITEHIIDQLKEKAEEFLQGWDDEISARIKDLDKKGLWPFETVSTEYFLDVIQPFMRAVDDIEKAEALGFNSHVGTLHDKISYTSINVIHCIQKMELETILQMAIENATQQPGMYSDKCRNMNTLWQWALDELYETNNYAIDMLLPTYKDAQRLPLRICDASEWDFTVPEAVRYTENTIREHEEVFGAIAKISKDLLQYGLPSDTAAGQIIDKIIADWEHIKEQNQMLLGCLAERELEIDYINTFVLHSLRKQAICFLAMDTIQKQQENISQTTDFRDIYKHYMDGISQIETLIKDMRKREAQMLPEVTLTISKVGDGNYAITVSQAKGSKIQVGYTDNNTETKYTTEKKRYENTRVMKIGKKSHAVAMEKKIRRAVLLSDKEENITNINSSKKDNEKEKVIKEKVLGEFTATTTRTTKAHGKRTARLDLQARAFKFQRRNLKTHQIGPKTVEKEISSASIEPGASGSIVAPTKDNIGTYLISVDAHPVKIGVNYHGLKLDAQAGFKASVGHQVSVEDIIKSASRVLAQELMNGSAANFTRIIDNVSALLKEAAPEAQANWGSIKISASDITLFKAQVSEQEDTQKMTVETGSPAFDELQDIADSAFEILDTLTEKEHTQQKILTGGDISPEVEMECLDDYGYDLVL